MDDLRELFELTAAIAADFYETLPERPVYPRATVAELHAALAAPLPEHGLPARTVIEELAAAADPGLVAEASGRYFGFVIGGAVPASIAADWLTSTWDQNAGLFVGGPSASIVEQVAGAWLIELLGLPRHASFGFVTGGQMATFTALAAARHHVLAQVGWDVERDGLQGAPKIRVVVGAKRHGTVDRALRMLGLGTPTDLVPVDAEGRMLARAQLRIGDEPTIVCAQAGEVNTGASDPFHAIADAREPLRTRGSTSTERSGSGRRQPRRGGTSSTASGAPTPGRRTRTSGSTCRTTPDSPSPRILTRTALPSPRARPYLIVDDDKREQLDWNPEHSRRARGFAVYAAIRSLGRAGIAELVERTCAHAKTFAARLEVMGAEVLNGVELNQVLFRFPKDEQTEAVLAGVQASGEAWMSGTVWDGRPAIRISVSNWQTSEDDVERTLAAFRELAPA